MTNYEWRMKKGRMDGGDTGGESLARWAVPTTNTPATAAFEHCRGCFVYGYTCYRATTSFPRGNAATRSHAHPVLTGREITRVDRCASVMCGLGSCGDSTRRPFDVPSLQIVISTCALIEPSSAASIADAFSDALQRYSVQRAVSCRRRSLGICRRV
jgi:hypothetical protein